MCYVIYILGIFLGGCNIRNCEEIKPNKASIFFLLKLFLCKFVNKACLITRLNLSDFFFLRNWHALLVAAEP